MTAEQKAQKQAEKQVEKEKLSKMTKDEQKAYKIEKKKTLHAKRASLVNAKEKAIASDASKREEKLRGVDGFKGTWLRFWFRLGRTGFCQWWRKLWTKSKIYFPGLSQFFVFFMLSNGVTVFQMVLTVILQDVLVGTDLVNQSLRILGPIAKNFNGTNYYLFDFYQGLPTQTVMVDGIQVLGKGGAAYFLAFLIPLALAQIINFFAQRNITFKSKSNPWVAAGWYFIAWILITLISNALLGLYQGPLYTLLIVTWNMGSFGNVLGGLLVSFVQCIISFWVFFPIFKVIFPSAQKDQKVQTK